MHWIVGFATRRVFKEYLNFSWSFVSSAKTGPPLIVTFRPQPKLKV